MAWVANRSTTVRNAISPITRLRWTALPPAGARPWMRRRMGVGQRGHRVGSGAGGGAGVTPGQALSGVTGAGSDGGACRRHMMCASSCLCRRSAESSTAVALPVFFHQCEVPLTSSATSPAWWTIGTAQLLAYSVTSPIAT